MNIIFFGNGLFSQKSLESLHTSKHHNILLVVTNDTKRQGRGLKYKNTPVSKFAEHNKIELFKTNNIKNSKNVTKLKKYNADIFVVIEYKILPKEIFNIPKFGSINIHGSLLPKYRGAAPIQRAIMNGDTHLGVTSFKINSNIDSGKLICNESSFFPDTLTYGEIYSKLSILGGNLLIKTLDKVTNNETMIDQQIKQVSNAPKIKKNELKITFNDTSFNIYNKIRALTPPCPYAVINSKKIKLIKTYYSKKSSSLNVGEHILINKNIQIGCLSGTIIVKELQFESKRKISSIDFSNMQHLKNIKFE